MTGGARIGSVARGEVLGVAGVRVLKRIALAAAFALAPSLASAEPQEPARRILRPEAMATFQRLAAAADATARVAIRIDEDRAVLTFERDGAVARIEAREASTCATPAGVVCLRVAEAPGPTSSFAQRMLDALGAAARSSEEPSPWSPPDPTPTPTPSPSPSPPRPRRPDTPRWVVAGSTFLAVVLLGAAVALVRIRRELATRAATAPALIFLFALAVRFAAHPGPGDIRDVLQMTSTPRRAGWSSYLHLVFCILPPAHESVWSLHRVLGALAAPLLYAALRARFSRLAALAGSATLAALPLVARFDASDTPYVPLCTAFIASTVALDRFAHAGSRAALALGLGLLTVAMQLRPDGPWLVVPSALLFASHPGASAARERRWLLRASVLGALACFVAVNVPFSLWALFGHTTPGQRGPSELRSFVGFGGVFFSPWLDLATSPLPVTLLVLSGALVAARRRGAALLWLLATVTAMPLASGAIGQLSHARLHLPSMHLAAGLAGLSIAAIVEVIEAMARARGAQFAPAATTALAIGLPIAAALPRADVLVRRWTPQSEFERFRAGIRALSDRPTIITLFDVRDGGFVPAADPRDPDAYDLVDLERFAAAPAAAVGSFYYRAANCVSPDAADPSLGRFHLEDGCDAFESRYALSPVWEASLPALPYRGERYTRDPVPIGLYRVVGLAEGSRR